MGSCEEVEAHRAFRDASGRVASESLYGEWKRSLLLESDLEGRGTDLGGCKICLGALCLPRTRDSRPRCGSHAANEVVSPTRVIQQPLATLLELAQRSSVMREQRSEKTRRICKRPGCRVVVAASGPGLARARLAPDDVLMLLDRSVPVGLGDRLKSPLAAPGLPPRAAALPLFLETLPNSPLAVLRNSPTATQRQRLDSECVPAYPHIDICKSHTIHFTAYRMSHRSDRNRISQTCMACEELERGLFKGKELCTVHVYLAKMR